MIEISAIAARRLPIPSGCDLYFVATVTLGEASVSSAPAKPVVDHRLGSSIAFRDPLVLPCYVDGTIVDPRTFGLSVQIRSVCGTVHLGVAIARVSKQWYPIVPHGEVMCSFALNETLKMASPPIMENSDGERAVNSANPQDRKRPATAGPGGARGAAVGASGGGRAVGPLEPANVSAQQDGFEEIVTTSAYSAVLTLTMRSISGLMIDTGAPASVYVSVQYARDERQTEPLEVIPDQYGHWGKWDDEGYSVTFDVLPSNVTRLMTLSVLGAWSTAEGAKGPNFRPHLLGIAKVDVPTNLGGENQTLSQRLVVSGHPRSKLDVSLSLVYNRPRKEGAGGRPLSAYPRRAPGASSPGAPPSPHQAAPSRQQQLPSQSQSTNQPAVSQEEQAAPVASNKLRSRIGAGRNAWGDGSSSSSVPVQSGGAASSAQPPSEGMLLEMEKAFENVLTSKLEESVVTAVNVAVARVMDRLNALEQRLARSEEAIAQLRLPPPAPSRTGSGGYNRIPKAPGSRPGSADSVVSGPNSAPSYDVSHSIITEQQLRNKFQEYDVTQSGTISLAQLISFYKSGSAYGDDESDDRVLRYLDHCGVRIRSSEGVSFDDFAKVALRLAQR